MTVTRLGVIADVMGKVNILPSDVRWVECREAAIALGTETAGMLNGEIPHRTWLGDHIGYEVQTAPGALFIVDAQMERQLASGSGVFSIDFKPQGLLLIAQ